MLLFSMTNNPDENNKYLKKKRQREAYFPNASVPFLNQTQPPGPQIQTECREVLIFFYLTRRDYHQILLKNKTTK